MYLDDSVPQRLSDVSLERRKAHQKRRSGHFVKGPIPVVWLSRAGALPGKAVSVGMAVWFEAGRRGSHSGLSICNSLLDRFGVSRTAGYRGLAALEKAGLVKVERHRGRCPRVTIRAVRAWGPR